MREEIAAAVVFITRMVKKNEDISKDKASEFSDRLSALLVDKFKNHWYEENPLKGQGYRCIRVNETGPRDPVLEKAASECGLAYQDLKMPPELTLWVDPKEVCCRFGEAKGSYCTVAAFNREGNMDVLAHKINLDNVISKAQVLKEAEMKKIMAGRSKKPQPDSPVPAKKYQTDASSSTKKCQTERPGTSLKAKTNQQNMQNRNSNNKRLQPNNRYYHSNMQRGQFNVNAKPFMSKMSYMPTFHSPDKYHWVRGADLVKA